MESNRQLHLDLINSDIIRNQKDFVSQQEAIIRLNLHRKQFLSASFDGLEYLHDNLTKADMRVFTFCLRHITRVTKSSRKNKIFDRIKDYSQETNTLLFGYSHSYIAERLKTDRKTVSRAFNKFQRLNIAVKTNLKVSWGSYESPVYSFGIFIEDSKGPNNSQGSSKYHIYYFEVSAMLRNLMNSTDFSKMKEFSKYKGFNSIMKEFSKDKLLPSDKISRILEDF